MSSAPSLAALGELCMAICHDVRGPLATAGAAIEMLARQGGHVTEPSPQLELELGLGAAPTDSRAGRGDDARHLVDIARSSLAQAEDLLAALPGMVAAPPAARLAPLALDDVVAAAGRDVACELRLAGGRIRVDGPLPWVLGDGERLRIALRNLLRNAIRHRRSAAAVEIRIATRAARRAGRCTLLVSDNGGGIPREERERVFAPLYRAGASAGSGIGLSIARHAVEASGGRLALGPAARGGACFALTLRLPGSAFSANRAWPGSAPAASPAASSGRRRGS